LLSSEFDFQTDEPQRVCEGCFKKHSQLVTGSGTFDKCGPENAPAIVMLHPEGGNRKSVAPLMKELSRVYTVLAPDFPGMGNRGDDKLTVDSAVKAVFDLIKQNIPSQTALLVGHGLGALVAVEMASKNPTMCSGVVCIGTGDSQATTFAAKILTNNFQVKSKKNPSAKDQWESCVSVMGSMDIWRGLEIYTGPKMLILSAKEAKKAMAKLHQVRNTVRLEILASLELSSSDERVYHKIYDLLWKFLAEVGW